MSQLDLWTDDAARPEPVPDGTYQCPGCARKVTDEYVEGDALCCWCRDINDPRLSTFVRQRRES